MQRDAGIDGAGSAECSCDGACIRNACEGAGAGALLRGSEDDVDGASGGWGDGLSASAGGCGIVSDRSLGGQVRSPWRVRIRRGLLVW